VSLRSTSSPGTLHPNGGSRTNHFRCISAISLTIDGYQYILG
jgi:hypothetical protein